MMLYKLYEYDNTGYMWGDVIVEPNSILCCKIKCMGIFFYKTAHRNWLKFYGTEYWDMVNGIELKNAPEIIRNYLKTNEWLLDIGQEQSTEIK